MSVSSPVLKMVSVICEGLTDDELCAINLAAQLDFDPRQVMGYEKARALFTVDNGLRAHEETKRALSVVVMDRLGALP